MQLESYQEVISQNTHYFTFSNLLSIDISFSLYYSMSVFWEEHVSYPLHQGLSP